MGKLGIFVSGAGSQYPGMGRELADKFPAARSVFAEADQALGFSVSELCFSAVKKPRNLPRTPSRDLDGIRGRPAACWNRKACALILWPVTAWENIPRSWPRAGSTL